MKVAEPSRMELTGLRCAGRHGAYPGERDVTRTFLVDLALAGEVGADGTERVVATTRHAVGSHSRALLERVADDVARAILSEFTGVDAVRVRLAKPDPPGLDASLEAVTLSRDRRQRG
jgi:dihydroneopterin aldolase